ncbi:MAG: cytochrome c oxidase subunit II [Proteobacteria bacterium]|nr:cytochrome c oxidase subunit II [Pseudomonadota bacterium]MBI3496182.1 cytochrome c oxidase subunit II [Pseudomonadota bacterium]
MPIPRRRCALFLLMGILGLGLLGRSGAEERPIVHITAKRFEYEPPVVKLKKGVPVTIELTALDRQHGFKVPQLGLRVDAWPGETTRVELIPDKSGTFEFVCDVFCGSGHEDMDGKIIVEE